MKAKIVSMAVIVSFLLMTFAATPVRAGANTTDFTGTMEFAGGTDAWVVTPGGTIHDQVNDFGFLVTTADQRVAGIYVVTGKCTFPGGKAPYVWGPCSGTWTLNNDGDPEPEWEGLMTTTGRINHDQYNFTGHGLGEYAGLKVSFKVYDFTTYPGTVVGQVIGN